MTITPSQYASLTKIFDVFIPAIIKKEDSFDYWATKASDKKVVEKTINLINNLKIEDQKDLLQAFQLIDSPLLGITWLGAMKPARSLTPIQIEKMLKKWATHPISDIRNLYNTLKKLAAIIYFGDAPNDAQNHTHKAIQYQNTIVEKPTNSHKINVLNIDNKDILECDTVIIGSGAGGSVVAAELAKRGQKVIIVEKGAYYQEEDFNQKELEMINKLYEAQGLVTSKSGSIAILAGSTVGGGTTINWAGSLRTPDFVLEQWAADFQNPHFTNSDYQKYFEQIEQRNNVNTNIKHNSHNALLFQTSEKQGFKAEIIPQNVKKPPHISDETFWAAQGFSCLGDAYGIKQSAPQTFLADACAHGATIVPDFYTEKIIIEQGKAKGIIGHKNGKKITIKAKNVVASAGAIHTPALLLRSGLQHHEIGRNLFLHPVVPIIGRYETVMNPWNGPMMTTIVKDFARCDGNYGFRIECPPVHPALASVIMSWENGEAFKDEILNLRHAGIFFGLVRDKFGGRVKLSSTSKSPEIHYTLHDYDKKHLLKGFEEVIKLHIAAGATRISIPHNQQVHFLPKKEKIEDIVAKMYAQKWKTNYFGVYSAHQMGTVRMGGNNNCPVKPNGETREVKNLFVADASLFPSASGANPMLSNQALSLYVSQFIV
jgi:choline dehydrogenase-like flavoprotein